MLCISSSVHGVVRADCGFAVSRIAAEFSLVLLDTTWRELSHHGLRTRLAVIVRLGVWSTAKQSSPKPHRASVTVRLSTEVGYCFSTSFCECTSAHASSNSFADSIHSDSFAPQSLSYFLTLRKLFTAVVLSVCL